MAYIKNWSAAVNNTFAWNRAGKRRQYNKMQHLNKIIRQRHLAQVCLDYNYPFVGNVRGIRKVFLEIMRRHDPDYYVSHYTIVYDLQDIFGKNYVRDYKTLRFSGLFYYENNIYDLIRSYKD